MFESKNNDVIGIIGLGYVGLPLAVSFGKKMPTLGFDINQSRIEELKNGYDRTREISKESLFATSNLTLTSNEYDLKSVNIFILTVPTPIDKYNNPDLTPLVKASECVARNLKNGDIVIYESTVFPGCTEEVCVPILEKISGLKFNSDFYCGYSPERINPGDKVHTLEKIKKVTSGSTPKVAEKIDSLYRTIISAGTHMAPSIKVAEAAKVIENTQRDLNIAFINELAKIFQLIGIDTSEVLEAAGTKWNFLKFTPGLVGGHCIGVDPYYLTYKAQELGYNPEVILAGRRINDNMGAFIANNVIKLLLKKNGIVNNTRVLILGATFKENCPDVRNSKIFDIYRELIDYSIKVEIFDPLADKSEVSHEYKVDLIDNFNPGDYQAIILAVAHDFFKEYDFASFCEKGIIVYDVKSVLPKNKSNARL